MVIAETLVPVWSQIWTANASSSVKDAERGRLALKEERIVTSGAGSWAARLEVPSGTRA